MKVCDKYVNNEHNILRCIVSLPYDKQIYFGSENPFGNPFKATKPNEKVQHIRSFESNTPQQ